MEDIHYFILDIDLCGTLFYCILLYNIFFIEDPTLTPVQIAMIVLSILIVMILAIIITVLLVRKYCRKKYTVIVFSLII